MGVQSKMNYTGMDAIVKLVENRMTVINDKLELLSGQVVTEIAAAYDGEAAAAYKETLTTISTQMNQDLNDIVTKLKTAITETQAEYQKQDALNQQSVADAKATYTANSN